MSDPFSSSGSAFVNNDDLAGRTLLIRPDEIGSRKSKNKPDETYEYIVCDVVVLSGETSDKIEEVPVLLESIQLTGAGVVNHLRPKLRKRDKDGRRKLALQKLTTVKSTVRGQNDAWVLDLPDDMDAAANAARSYLADDASILAVGVQDDDAFA